MFKERQVIGYSLLAEIKGVEDSEVEIIYETAVKPFNVVQEFSYFFEPYGLTKVAILSESHLIIHTYPEIKQVSLDIYSCSLESIEKFRQIIEELSRFYKTDYQVIERGIDNLKNLVLF